MTVRITRAGGPGLLQREVHRHGHDDWPLLLRWLVHPLPHRIDRRLIEERDRSNDPRLADGAIGLNRGIENHHALYPGRDGHRRILRFDVLEEQRRLPCSFGRDWRRGRGLPRRAGIRPGSTGPGHRRRRRRPTSGLECVDILLGNLVLGVNREGFQVVLHRASGVPELLFLPAAVVVRRLGLRIQLDRLGVFSDGALQVVPSGPDPTAVEERRAVFRRQFSRSTAVGPGAVEIAALHFQHAAQGERLPIVVDHQDIGCDVSQGTIEVLGPLAGKRPAPVRARHLRIQRDRLRVERDGFVNPPCCPGRVGPLEPLRHGLAVGVVDPSDEQAPGHQRHTRDPTIRCHGYPLYRRRNVIVIDSPSSVIDTVKERQSADTVPESVISPSALVAVIRTSRPDTEPRADEEPEP